MTNWHARLYTRLNQVLLDICFFSASMALACMIHVGAWLALSGRRLRGQRLSVDPLAGPVAPP